MSVELVDTVSTPEPVDVSRRRDEYWRYLERLHLGLIRYRDGGLRLLGVLLIRFGDPVLSENVWRWPIEGGLLAARPGGVLGFGAEDGRLTGFVRGYHPAIPEPLYSLTQRPFHHLVTRLFLLHLRGRRHPAGVPAEPAGRLAAAGLDAALILTASRLLPRRRRPLWTAGLALAYAAGSWAAVGQTLGQRVLGQRVTAVDGSRVTPGQALLRAALLPLVPLTFRGIHDEVAETEVIRVSG